MIHHRGYRIRILAEQLLSVPQSSPDPREGSRQEVIVHSTIVIGVKDHEWGYVLKDPLKAALELDEYQTEHGDPIGQQPGEIT